MLLPALARELARNVKDLNVFKRLFDFGGFIIAKNESCLSSFFAALAVGRMRNIAPVASWPHSEAAAGLPASPTRIYIIRSAGAWAGRGNAALAGADGEGRGLGREIEDYKKMSFPPFSGGLENRVGKSLFRGFSASENREKGGEK